MCSSSAASSSRRPPAGSKQQAGQLRSRPQRVATTSREEGSLATRRPPRLLNWSSEQAAVREAPPAPARPRGLRCTAGPEMLWPARRALATAVACMVTAVTMVPSNGEAKVAAAVVQPGTAFSLDKEAEC
eukprot:COSAG01_NODE_10749_length_2088_cov_7.949723_2_plen_130_part_00